MKKSVLFVAILSAIYVNQASAEQVTTKKTEAERIEVIGHKISVFNHDAAASISVLTEKEIARTQAVEMSSLLKELPGVDISGSVTPLSSQPVIRGLTGERIHISVDNVKRKNESDGDSSVTSINSLGIDPDQVKQVQVLRGADSLTVGSGALGGSIRLVTKDASDYLSGVNGFGARASVAHQSASESNRFGVSAFSLSDGLDTVLHISQIKFDDIDIVGKNKSDYKVPKDEEPVELLNKIKNESSRTNITLKNTWHFAPMHSIKSKLDWSETESIDQPYGQRQSLAIFYPKLLEDYNNDYIEAMANYAYQPGSDLIDLDVQLVYSKKNYQEVSKGYYERGDKKISMDKISKGATKRSSIRLANLAKFEGLITHSLAVEVNYERENFTQSEVDKGVKGTYYGDSDSSDLSISVIDQAEFFDGQFLVTAGLRYDDYERSNNIFSTYESKDSGELSNELGLTFKATDYLNFYLKYAEAFRAPSVQELYKKNEWRCHRPSKFCYSEPQPDLKPETSENYEAGFGLSWQDTGFADNLSIKAIYFDNKIDNYISNVPFMYYIDADGNKQLGSPNSDAVKASGIPLATHRDYSAQNIGRLNSKGVEVEVSYQMAKFDAYLGYSTMNMDVNGMPDFYLGTIDTSTQPYVDAPADKVTLNLNYQVFDDF